MVLSVLSVVRSASVSLLTGVIGGATEEGVPALRIDSSGKVKSVCLTVVMMLLYAFLKAPSSTSFPSMWKAM